MFETAPFLITDLQRSNQAVIVEPSMLQAAAGRINVRSAREPVLSS